MTLMKSCKHASRSQTTDEATGKRGRPDQTRPGQAKEEKEEDDHVDEKRNQTGNRSARTAKQQTKKDATDERQTERA